APGAGAGAAKPAPSWARAEIATVVAAGLLAPDVTSVRPDEPLTQGELAELASGLARLGPARLGLARLGQATAIDRDTGIDRATPEAPERATTLAELDARLVRVLGLQDAAAAFAAGARAAGLKPPDRFGTEAVARLLGLRTNHPAALDALELRPNDPVTRAEAAFSAARILRLDGARIESVRAAAATFVLPALEPRQRMILGRAFSFVGFPYVWGGESERRAGPFGPQPQGGFDCSGFVWRVYKLERYPGAEALADTLKGRTTYAMSGEVGRAERIAFAQLRPGDVAFFGARGPRSRPAEVDHMGIYAGGGWLVHSSRDGTTVTPLAGWYRERFAWGRRPLAEAGIDAADPLR
ncbi:MAG TPA: NlpC/P60 family protein, partial [Gaiellaceae bacterium]|nr:NlpC/P60 family protein [Gaiellaceae bacterium]